jgi:hypothetical protein
MNATVGHAQGTALAVAPSGGVLTAPPLLGRGTPRIPVGGRIRAGIKVLTRRAAEDAVARRLYDEGVAAGRSFEAIEREIEAKCEGLRHPLTPKNVPYFTVRGEDFPNPEIARLIMAQYAEDRGEGVRRLYRFPVVFPADSWQSVMPHELVTWASNERRYWSEYAEDGQTRNCMTHQPLPPAANGQRVIRVFGGRKTMLRPENSGLCEPEACPEYQDRRCNLSGRFIFFVPGIQTLDAFELPTNSFYAMQAAVQKFRAIAFMRGGRISGFLDGRRTPFYISKRLVEVSRIGDDGRATRVAQWLIELEAPVDVTAVLRPGDGLEAIEQRAAQARAVLEGRRAPDAQVSEDGVIEVIEPVAGAAADPVERTMPSAQEPKPASGEAATVGHDDATASRNKAPGAPSTSSTQRASATAARGSPESDVAWIFDAAAALGIEPERFAQYAEKRWGKGWKVAAGGRKRAIDDVSQFQENAAAFQDKVNAELDVWA